MERRAGFIGAGIALFLVSCVLGVACPGDDLNAKAAGPHDPILITSDADFTIANGVVSGDGTEGNPYIIEDWEIDALDGNGIEISGTTAWFEIRNVAVYSTAYAIYLNNAMHATINSTIVSSEDSAIMVIACPGCVIIGNHATATYSGIVAAFSNGYVIRDNWATITDEGAPIAIGISSWSLVEQNTITGDLGNGIYIIQCDNTTVRSNIVGPNGCLIEDCVNCSFWDNTFDHSGFGVSGDSGEQLGTLDIPDNNTANGRPIRYYKNLVDTQIDRALAGQIIIANCSGLTVSNMTVEDITNSWEPWYTAGLQSLWNDDLTLDNLTLRGNAVGVLASQSPGLTIKRSNFSDSLGLGATVEDSAGTTVAGCDFWKSSLDISSSWRSTVRNCTLYECGVGVSQCDDAVLSGLTQSWADGNGISLYDCNNAVVANCTMSSNGRIYYSGYGLYLDSLTNCSISNNSILENRRGIEMNLCSDTNFTGNEVRENLDDGVYIDNCLGCSVNHNTVVGNTVAGIWIGDSNQYVNVSWNVLEGNNYGIYFQLPEYSTIHHNDFGGNMANAFTHIVHPSNYWDDGYPSGGNYWSDYTGSDDFNGPAQDIPGADGIGDTQYAVRGGGITPYYDRYPFMNPLMVAKNTPPVAAFDITPATGNITVEFTLDASSSYDLEDPSTELEVRWDIGYDGVWDIDWSTEKIAKWRFTASGANNVRLQVRDTRLYLADASSTIYLTGTAPTASFVVSPTIGNSSTSFFFDASSSHDLEDTLGVLKVRWDWEDDGTWDTDWLSAKIITHSFSTNGTLTVALEVMDSAGLTSNTTREVVVDNIAPVPDAGSDQTVDVGVSVTLDGSASADNIAIATYTWSCIVNGEVKTVYGVSSMWTFDESGDYEVVLVVQDTAGNSAVDTVMITVKSEDGGTLVDYWWAIVVVAVIAVAGVAVFMLKARKGKI